MDGGRVGEASEITGDTVSYQRIIQDRKRDMAFSFIKIEKRETFARPSQKALLRGVRSYITRSQER